MYCTFASSRSLALVFTRWYYVLYISHCKFTGEYYELFLYFVSLLFLLCVREHNDLLRSCVKPKWIIFSYRKKHCFSDKFDVNKRIKNLTWMTHSHLFAPYSYLIIFHWQCLIYVDTFGSPNYMPKSDPATCTCNGDIADPGFYRVGAPIYYLLLLFIICTYLRSVNGYNACV